VTVFLIREDLRKAFCNLIKGEVLFDESMRNHTSFRIGGPAEVLVAPKDELDLKESLRFCGRIGVRPIVIGNGTKLLVSDEGIPGIVVKISGCLDSVFVSGTDVRVGAGRLLTNLSRSVSDQGLSGLEFAVGIPGTVGGGVVMNAGAHGSMMSDVVTNLTVMDLEGNINKRTRNELSFGYRHSGLQDGPGIIVTVEICLKKGDAEITRERMREYVRWRSENQPQGFPTAGSTFKNPADISAGKLIDMAGLKGLRIGNAKISEKHANFIINLGNARASDVLLLMRRTQEEVQKKFGVNLQPEIRVLGRLD